jgi:hypothetical protein
MKFLIVPPDVRLRDLTTRVETDQPPFTYWKWIQEFVLMDVRFGISWKTGHTATKIADALFQKPPGSVVALEDADYELLKEAVEEPQHTNRATGQVYKGYDQPALLQQIGSFIDAVLNARATKPAEPSEPVPEHVAQNGTTVSASA